MNVDPEDVLHNLPVEPVVFLVLNRDPVEDDFRYSAEVLQAECGPPEAGAGLEHGWRSVATRLSGSARWDRVRPRYRGTTKTEEGWRSVTESRCTLRNLHRVHGFPTYQRDGIRYILDAFNPKNELGLPPAAARDGVLALILGEATFPATDKNLPIRDRLADVVSFWRVLRGLIEGLPVREVRGGTYIARVVLGYLKGAVPPGLRPWDFLWPLSTISAADLTEEAVAGLGQVSVLVRELTNRRLLVQVTRGLHSRMDREIETAGELVGLPSVTGIDV